jgi:hypothetical protein
MPFWTLHCKSNCLITALFLDAYNHELTGIRHAHLNFSVAKNKWGGEFFGFRHQPCRDPRSEQRCRYDPQNTLLFETLPLWFFVLTHSYCCFCYFGSRLYQSKGIFGLEQQIPGCLFKSSSLSRVLSKP